MRDPRLDPLRKATDWDPSFTVAKVIAHGHSWVEIFCPRCKSEKTMPFRELGEEVGQLTLGELRHRLRCKRCTGFPPAPILTLKRPPDPKAEPGYVRRGGLFYSD
jgi:hypothetical protein